jgi:hypothetical protein
MLEKMRRGAERLYVKHRESLATATVVLRQDIAKELGLKFTETKPVESNAGNSEPIGLFEDEPTAEKIVRTPHIRVKLTDYIAALKSQPTKPAEKAADKK